MIRLIPVLSLSALLAGTCAAQVPLGAPVLLTAGTDPTRHWTGWANRPQPTAWVLREGALTLEGGVEDGWHVGGGYLVSRGRWRDFELRFAFRTAAGANSGVMVRVVPGPSVAWPWQSGTEFQILDAAAPRGQDTAADGTADLYGLVAAEGPPAPADLRWREARIVACGPRLEHWLDGHRVVAVDVTSPAFRRQVAGSKFAAYPAFAQPVEGHVALQDHGRPVWFRDMRLQPLAGCAGDAR